MGIKQFNCLALLDFSNVIRPIESNLDGETSHFAMIWTLKNTPQSYRPLFHVSEWKKTFWATEHQVMDAKTVIPQFGHYVKLASMLGTLPWGLD